MEQSFIIETILTEDNEQKIIDKVNQLLASVIINIERSGGNIDNPPKI